MTALDALVTPLIKKGQSLTHICAEHGEELPVSQRTLYNYIDSGTLSVGNLDLRRKVGYRPRNDFSIVEFPKAVNAYPFFLFAGRIILMPRCALRSKPEENI